jgi:hypothetical protein
MRIRERQPGAFLIACLSIPAILLALPTATLSDDAGSAAARLQSVELETIEQAAASQEKIKRLDAETRRMATDYRNLQLQSERLTRRKLELEEELKRQAEELVFLQQQAEWAPQDKEIDGYLRRLVTSLEQFIRADLPFQQEKRLERVEALSLLLEQPEVSPAERLRGILQAYQRELEYGRTIEAYDGELAKEGPAGDKGRWVTFLRYGRLALVYQTSDGAESGWWDPASGGWQPLDPRLGREVRRGIRIARKQMPPDLLLLPLRKSPTTPGAPEARDAS